MPLYNIHFITEYWQGDYLKEHNVDCFNVTEEQYREVLRFVKDMLGVR